MKLFFQISCKAALLINLVFLLQACTPAPQSSALDAVDVNAAFEMSGLIPVKPYTRTIFSTTNF